MVEIELFNSKIKSVDPTLIGWAVTLACYPPFNMQVNKVIPWAANDYFFFYNDETTFVVRIFMVLLLTIYVWATISLGAKCSNLTNRGIVAKGPYKYVRHPAYISKNIFWWITLLPQVFINPFVLISGIFWSGIYFLRANTEERHLRADTDYLEYCEKVKYKFIPKVY